MPGFRRTSLGFRPHKSSLVGYGGYGLREVLRSYKSGNILLHFVCVSLLYFKSIEMERLVQVLYVYHLGPAFGDQAAFQFHKAPLLFRVRILSHPHCYCLFHAQAQIVCYFIKYKLLMLPAKPPHC